MFQALSSSTTGAPTRSDASPDVRRVSRTFTALAAAGLVGSGLYCVITRPLWLGAVITFGGATLVSGAFAFFGALIGFVFAIPRSRQDGGVVQRAATQDTQQVRTERTTVTNVTRDGESGTVTTVEGRFSDYSANTNLEQISDWLTKILVGITLTQFDNMAAWYRSAATALAPLLGTADSARAATLALMTYFMIWGFFISYLLTRLWMPKALSRSEREELVQSRQVEHEAALRSLERQAYDLLYEPGGYTRAIELIEKYLSSPNALPSPWLWLYLAAAYGQRHADEIKNGNIDAANATKEKVIHAVQEALRLNPGTKPILQQLYEGKSPGEDDLVSLKGDPRLDELLRS